MLFTFLGKLRLYDPAQSAPVEIHSSNSSVWGCSFCPARFFRLHDCIRQLPKRLFHEPEFLFSSQPLSNVRENLVSACDISTEHRYSRSISLEELLTNCVDC